ncbi:helix-turn-helix domain-containing protein, partial [Neobacillus vireti]|uniref:helix-turn-helix domain-containing protein n=1 Tax=Neobacillus vireti TaxID=220686 RepID=UPI002FFEF1E5
KGEIVIIFWDKFPLIEKLLIQIYRTLKNGLGISCPIAVGKQVNNSSMLMDSYEHAKKVLLNSNILMVKETRVYMPDTKPSPSLRSLIAYSSSIELAVQAGEIEAFGDVIQQIIGDFTKDGYLSLHQLLHFENEYLVISRRWYKNFNISIEISDQIEKRVDIFFDQNGSFQLEEFVKRIKREIVVFLKKIKRSSIQKNSNIIYDIEKYLQANFDRDVKLQEISEQFYISREYISRKFKQEFQVNISDYLVSIRMKKAKSLLKNSQLKIYEIAAMIGYQDDKYFRKVFKKVEGITPNEYRAEYVKQ